MRIDIMTLFPDTVNAVLHESIIGRAAKKGIHVGCLSDFCIGSSTGYEHTLILNFSDLDEETQLEAVRRLGQVLNEDEEG